jgi:molybdate transport system substrate-binding protein
MPSVTAVLLAALALAGPARGRADAVAIAAASNVRTALDEIVEAFRRQHPGTEVQVSYGASGNLFAQIVNGAPFDLFLSADDLHPRKLVEAGAAVAGGLVPYARGRLALWLPAGSAVPLDQGIDALRDERIRRIAIANPAHAPYGVAAEQALRASGLLEQVRPRLVVGEDVAQAAQFAESGNADAALLPVSLALTPRLQRAGRWRLVPEGLHAPLDQVAVVTTRGRRNEAAAALLRFVVGPDGRSILARWGFERPRG